MALSASAAYFRDDAAEWELHCPVSRERNVLYIPSLGKDPNSELVSVVSTKCILLLHYHKVKKS